MHNGYYLDILTRKELLNDAENSPSYSVNIVEPDYIVSSNSYEKDVHDTFDCIIADNVFEHIANPIKWLKTMSLLLEDRGCLFLRIPEYGTCFDRFRSPTNFAHLVSDYIRDVPDKDPVHSVEVGIYYDMNHIGEENNIADKINLERSINDYKNPHFGVHCHTFSGKHS